MEEILHFFPIILYLLGSVLLVVLIVLGIKLIHTVDKANVMIDSAYNKIESLNGFFHVIDTITNTFSHISDSVVTNVTSIIEKILHKRKKEKEIEEDE